MDNEMIERVAKAIFTKRYEEHGTYKNLKWETYRAKEFYLEDARQAIKAMREPTEKILSAGAYYSTAQSGVYDCDDVWKSMIDAVIE